jgi:sulfide:quinone oxidoreductase
VDRVRRHRQQGLEHLVAVLLCDRDRKAGVFASSGGEAVAQTIAHAITGKGRPGAVKGDGTCFVEVGHGMAAAAAGNFFHEPLRKVKLRWPMFHWHWVKVGLEKYFLWKFI